MIKILEEKKMPCKYDGLSRTHLKCECSNCSKHFWRLKKEVDKKIKKNQKNIYCSQKCRRSQIVVKCSYCNNNFYSKKSRLKKSKSGLYFCCREHKDLAQRIEHGFKNI